MSNNDLNPEKEIIDRINYLYNPENKHHQRIRLILNSDLDIEFKKTLVLCEIAVNLGRIEDHLNCVCVDISGFSRGSL
ncbi:MAG: hypothetical protein Q8N97_10115 [Methanobacteriaceae archaeon]|nr:hypothetical protein [Methanobacteriaceae archaeon]